MHQEQSSLCHSSKSLQWKTVLITAQERNWGGEASYSQESSSHLSDPQRQKSREKTSITVPQGFQKSSRNWVGDSLWASWSVPGAIVLITNRRRLRREEDTKAWVVSWLEGMQAQRSLGTGTWNKLLESYLADHSPCSIRDVPEQTARNR